MPRAILIHPGFHKTGTSSLQQVLRRNRSALKGRVRIVLRGEMLDLVHAARGFSTWRDPFTLDKFAQRFRALLEQLGPLPKRVLCLSSEELAGHLPGREGIVDYSAAPLLAAEMERIAAEIYPEAPLAFCVTLRRPESWLRSAYWEHVKASSMTKEWDDFAASTGPGSDLAATADAIAATLSSPVHRIWLEAYADLPLGPAGPLLDLCGIPAELQRELAPVPPVNTRADDAVLLALLAANRDYTDRDARAAAKQEILKAAQETPRD